MASYSSKGPTLLDHIAKPDLVAPGNQIVSVMAPNSYLAATYATDVVLVRYYNSLGAGSSQYLSLSGTSMATPMVSGAAALLIQKDPTLTPDLVKARLMLTATKNFPASSVVTDPAMGTSYPLSMICLRLAQVIWMSGPR